MKISLKYRDAILACAVSSIFVIGGCFTGASAQAETLALSKEASFKQFLATWDADKTTKYIASFPTHDTNQMPDAIVYLTGNEWCGSGGCTTLILKQDGGSWRIVTKITLTRLPIRALVNVSNGWHSLGVWVQGGGIRAGYEAELNFDGKTYPRNPTIPPARRLKDKLPGEVLIPSPHSR